MALKRENIFKSDCLQKEYKVLGGLEVRKFGIYS